MRSKYLAKYLATVGLLILGAALLQSPASARVDGQPSALIQDAANRPQPDKNLPPDFIDSRPILAYFDNLPMPDTVRDLLTELKRPDRCGQDAKLPTEAACALVIYKLDDAFTPDRLRPPLIMRAVYRVTAPEDPANTVMLMPDGKGELKRYIGGDLFEPLRNIRANICAQDKRMPDKCMATGSSGVLYHPFGILGKLENDREDLLPAKSASKHFQLNLKPADEKWLLKLELDDLCLRHIICK